MPESPLVDAQILGSTRSGEELLHDDGRSPVYYQRPRSRSGHHRCQPAARPLGGQAAGVRCGSVKNAVITIARIDRKSTRLNSSHVSISYAVFCLKKKKEHGRT